MQLAPVFQVAVVLSPANVSRKSARVYINMKSKYIHCKDIIKSTGASDFAISSTATPLQYSSFTGRCNQECLELSRLTRDNKYIWNTRGKKYLLFLLNKRGRDTRVMALRVGCYRVTGDGYKSKNDSERLRTRMDHPLYVYITAIK